MQQGWVQFDQSSFSVIYRLIDSALVFGVWLLCCAIFGQVINQSCFIAGLLAAGFFTYISESMQLYRSWRSSSSRQMILLTSLSWILVCAVLLGIGFVLKVSEEFSRLAVGYWFSSTLLALCGWRYVLQLLLRYFRSHDLNTRTAAILGLTESGLRLASDQVRNPHYGIRVVGFYDDRMTKRDISENDHVFSGGEMPRFGTSAELVERARAGEIDIVYIALPMKAQDRISAVLKALSDTTATVHLVPDFFVYNLLHSRWHQVGDSYILSIHDTPIDGLGSWVKRLEDLTLSSIILLFISPLLLVIAILIMMTSRGSVLFKQTRYGLDGDAIKVWKFRTMRVQENGDKVAQATRNDDRITPLGAILRRTSLDELPQFINVLQGHMSIVGPRPHAVAHNEEYRKLVDGYMLRHKVKPGITGWAQINGWRGETDTVEKMAKRIEYDLQYIRNWSLWLDIKIIVKTVFKGFVNKNAY